MSFNKNFMTTISVSDGTKLIWKFSIVTFLTKRNDEIEFKAKLDQIRSELKKKKKKIRCVLIFKRKSEKKKTNIWTALICVKTVNQSKEITEKVKNTFLIQARNLFWQRFKEKIYMRN